MTQGEVKKNVKIVSPAQYFAAGRKQSQVFIHAMTLGSRMLWFFAYGDAQRDCSLAVNLFLLRRGDFFSTQGDIFHLFFIWRRQLLIPRWRFAVTDGPDGDKIIFS